jgi:beta-glucanase (GH16 family)
LYVASRLTRTLLAIACTTLLFGALFGSSASARKQTFNVTAPKAGVVAYGKIPVRAKLNVKRKSRVVRARFYIGKKRVTTDKRYPFAIRKSVKFDTRKIPSYGFTLKLTVRYEQRTKSGKLKKRKVAKKIRLKLDPGTGEVDQTGNPDPNGSPDPTPGPTGPTGEVTPTYPIDPGEPTPYDPNLLPHCPINMLVCEDFNGTELDRRLWRDQRRTGPDSGAGNYPWFAWNAWLEGAHYSPDNVTVADGLLTMKVTDVPSGNVDGYPEHKRPKSTGSINTDGKFSFKYGTMEARIKADACRLCWESFWLHNQGTSPRPEFDIMEFMQWAGRSPYTVLHGLVGPPPVNGVQYGNYEERLGGIDADLTGGWHTYRITRTPTSMTITIDNSAAMSCTVNDTNVATDDYMFPILSMAIADPAKAASVGVTGDMTPVPAGSMLQVDYVRVWKQGHGPTQLSSRACVPRG